MKIINQLRAGASTAPAFLIILYYLFFGLDLFTTYLATPDLLYEGNWFVRLLNLNWIEFITFYFLVVIMVTIGVFVALDFLHSYYQHNTSYNHSLIIQGFRNIKILFSYIILGCFYSHVINLGHIVINNYLSYIYIHQIENILSKISIYYISNQSFFLLYIKIVPIAIGYIVAAFKVKKIRDKYQAISA